MLMTEGDMGPAQCPFGNSAARLRSLRGGPVVLRPTLSDGLPFRGGPDEPVQIASGGTLHLRA
jgi:hypothetical protein